MLKFKTKKFIEEFNFPNPSWNNLPMDFPNLGKEGLTKEEKCLLDAIKLAWLTGTKNGRKKLTNTVVKSCSFLTVCIISLIGLINLISLSGQDKILKTVSAATVSGTLKQISKVEIDVENLIESTMSAVQRTVHPR